MSDLVGNPEDRFSQNEAYIISSEMNNRIKSLTHLNLVSDSQVKEATIMTICATCSMFCIFTAKSKILIINFNIWNFISVFNSRWCHERSILR